MAALLFLLLSGIFPIVHDWPTESAIIVLGIAQDAGYPQAGCTRACCEKVWSGHLPAQAVASLALVDPSSRRAWLIDATPDFGKQYHALLSHGYQLEGIILTHAHIGHYTGLIHLGREVMGAQHVPVYAMPRMRQFLSENGPWSLLVALQNIELHPIAPNELFRLGPFELTPFLVPHRDEFSETIGLLISGPRGKKACYIPDIDKWSKWDQPVEALIEQAQVALLDGTFYDGTELPGRDMSEIPHPFIVESMERFDRQPTAFRQKIHFIHFNHTNPVLDPDSDASKTVRARGYHLAKAGQWWPL